MLKNYIENGSETRVVSASFSDKTKSFTVFSQTIDKIGNLIDNRSFAVNGNIKCTVINDTITTEEELKKFIASVEKGTDKNSYYINLPDSYKGDYLSWNKICIQAVDGQIKQLDMSCVYFEKEAKYGVYDFTNRVFVTPRVPNCDKFFEENFGLSKHSGFTDVINMGYYLIKMYPEFKSCIDA